MNLAPNDHGFITNWLVSGLKEEPFSVKQEEKHQIKYEQYLRKIGIDNSLKAPLTEIKLKEAGCGGKPWRYYYSKNNWFVDLSNVCTVPTKLEAYAVTELVVEEACQVEYVIWTYSALEVWLDGKKINTFKEAVYKPIQKQEGRLELTPGKHTLFVRLQNVGVRDTRNLFGVQVLAGKEKVKISLPDFENLQNILEAEAWLNQTVYKDGEIIFESMPCFETFITWEEEGQKRQEKIEAQKISINEKQKVIDLTVKVDNQDLTKRFEIGEHWKPYYMQEATTELTHQKIYETLAQIPYQVRSAGVNFSVFHILARYAVGMQTPEDRDYLLDDLKHIQRTIDCSDFLMVGLIRLMKNYDLDEELLETIKQTLLGYRYWMDEEGSDGMCFWSENHALMFNGSQMVVGHMYPDEMFTRSGRTGKEQAAIGEARCKAWLSDVEAHGFEEFSSATYTSVTAIALLNLVDFGPEDISIRAAALLDKVLELFAMHIFDGVIIGPQGRVYRNVIYPFKQSAQEFVHFIDQSFPSVLAFKGAECMWLSCFATSRYQVPEGLVEKMNEDADYSYISAYAEINIFKNKDYILSSVTSPREDEVHIEEEELIPFTTPWVKEMNTRYHGTTLFEPGVYGYQQHLWYAALAKECPVFVNHPGATTDESHMRPGYWYGNGIFPAVKQKGNMLGAIHSITEEYPIHFTHLYWPIHEFDEMVRAGNWIFGKKKDGYIGVWCSEELVACQDLLVDREYRAYGSQSAYVCKCASKDEVGSFESFREACMAQSISFDKEKMILKVQDDFELRYEAVIDTTQYI